MRSSDIESFDIELNEEDNEEEEDEDNDDEDDDNDESDKSPSLLYSCSDPLDQYRKLSSSPDEFILMVHTMSSSMRQIASHIM